MRELAFKLPDGSTQKVRVPETCKCSPEEIYNNLFTNAVIYSVNTINKNH